MNKGISVELFDNGADWLQQARIDKVPGRFMFTEGPVWHPDNFFLFSDTPANKIYQLSAGGACAVYLENSGLQHSDTEELSDQVGSNGLAIDRNKNLLICQHGNHCIALLNKRKDVETLVANYNNRPFNSPNDIIVRHDGTIFFTDPPYGLAGQVLHPEKFQPFAGVYAYDYRRVIAIGDELKYPNGLIFSADGQYLLVSSNYPDQQCVVQYRMINDGSIEYAGVFLDINADGMTTDTTGNIYLATNEGVLMVSAQGKKRALLSLPETPSNLAWGGSRQEILMVTARSAVFLIHRP